MQKVTFNKDIYGDFISSTGERIGFYNGLELWGRGSTGWYITEIDGEFKGIKFNSLREAKNYVIKKHNPMQYTEIVIAEAEKVLAKYAKAGA